MTKLGRKSVPVEIRILKYFTVGNVSECWRWMGAKTSVGFPVIRDTKITGEVSATRVIWEKICGLGSIEKSQKLLKECDTDGCVNPYHYILGTTENRFWRYVTKPTGEEGCWIWVGAKNKDGYGNFITPSANDKAHRFSYRLFFGEFDPSLDVLHKCDNPSCVNPEHLELGTHTKNMAQMVSRGRSESMRGENSYHSRLSEIQVKNIRNDFHSGKYNKKELADKYQVTPPTIRAILSGKTWNWLE